MATTGKINGGKESFTFHTEYLPILNYFVCDCVWMYASVCMRTSTVWQ